jgi:hypothetical protein
MGASLSLMKTLLASLLFAFLALAFAPHPAALADGVCTAPSPSYSGKLPGNGSGVVLSTAPAVYITGACVTINGVTTTVIQGGVLTPIGDGSCYFVYKALPNQGHYAFVSQSGRWTPVCPAFRLTLRTVKSVG